jgi:hypothetical protein
VEEAKAYLMGCGAKKRERLMQNAITTISCILKHFMALL